MHINETIDKLISICNLDNDAIRSYNEALKHIDNQKISSQIQKYRDDHKRHVDELSRLITTLGGAPPVESGDIRGLSLSGATALQGLFGTEGALKALQTGEMVTNKSYANAIEQDFPLDILAVLKENYRDEKIHLEYVNKVLIDKSWENRKAA
jgi:hypothetical protein